MKTLGLLFIVCGLALFLGGGPVVLGLAGAGIGLMGGLVGMIVGLVVGIGGAIFGITVGVLGAVFGLGVTFIALALPLLILAGLVIGIAKLAGLA